MSAVVPFNRTLEQELLALARGLSLECLVCGEFVMRTHGGLFCPECGTTLRGSTLHGENAVERVKSDVQAG